MSLFHSVKKILKAKYKVGLYNNKPVKIKNITNDINNQADSILIKKSFSFAITLLKNKQSLLPLSLDDKIAHISLGDASSKVYRFQLKKFNIKTLKDIDSFNYKDKIKRKNFRVKGSSGALVFFFTLLFFHSGPTFTLETCN